MILAASLLSLSYAGQDGESLWDRLSFYANGRLRAESTFEQVGGEDRHRGRMRLRLGSAYRVTDEVTAEARVSTASDGFDANNPYWDFGDGGNGFQAANLGLDRFFLDWKPADSLRLDAGKMPHQLASPPVFSEFAWDDDVIPAGVAAIWKPLQGGQGSPTTLDLRLVEYVAVENGADEDATMFGAQANLGLRPGDHTSLQLSTSWSDWAHLAEGGTKLGDNQGNTDVTGEFGIWGSWASLEVEQGPLGRSTAFVQYLNNLDDDVGEDQGYSAGMRFGTLGKKGDLNVFGAYYSLDANSLYSPVAQDDTPIAGTGTGEGMSGFLAGAQFFTSDNLSIRLWVLTSDAGEDEDPFRIRIDVDFLVK
jgi:hypothetical protein